MVAFASDRRDFGWLGCVPSSPAVIVLRYKQLIGRSECPEMPHGITMREMLKAIYAVEDTECGRVSISRDLTRFASG
jgi:hypothetical protein